MSHSDSRPVLFVTNYAPPYRLGAFKRLHATENVDFVFTGGTVRHGGPITDPDGGQIGRPISQRDVFSEASSGRYRAVIAGISGRLALPSSWAGSKKAKIPFILWATLWSHPQTFAHALSFLPLRHIYRNADAIATYGPHVNAYLQGKGVRRPIFVAPQSVDNEYWRKEVSPIKLSATVQFMFSGRQTGEKGITVLNQAWRASGLSASKAALVLVGNGPFRARAVATGVAPPQGDGGPTRAWAAVSDYFLVKKSSTSSAKRSASDVNNDLLVDHATHSIAENNPTSGVNTTDLESFRFANNPSQIFNFGPQPHDRLRNFYAGSDVLILPSLCTREFCEPWGLVVNEAFNQGVPVIVSDAVGAAAGGLVRHEENGLIVPAGDVGALARAIRRLHDDRKLRTALGRNATASVVLTHMQLGRKE